MRLDHVTLRRFYEFSLISVIAKLHTSLPDDNSNLVPPDSISNSEVKRVNANGSAGSPCVRVGNRQAFFYFRLLVVNTRSLFLWLRYNDGMIVGLTGGIGSGKSSAAKFFIELGIDVIDADEVSKNILDKNLEAKDKFLEAFGKEFLDTNNKIDRSLLRSEIFIDKEKKTILESIIHPLVREQILKFIENSKSIYKIIMVPLIFETKSESFYDKIVVVDCEEKMQINRASKRDKKSTDNIINIMKAQASRQERNSIADIIIMNNDSLEDLKKEVTKTHQKLLGININE